MLFSSLGAVWIFVMPMHMFVFHGRYSQRSVRMIFQNRIANRRLSSWSAAGRGCDSFACHGRPRRTRTDVVVLLIRYDSDRLIRRGRVFPPSCESVISMIAVILV
ncbi:hypothetical protein EDD16DRAFT_903002 [Pisolithus croceorrhizus]|nr:hypothetical protein EDD16DRAFT_903002 [Pisolithus croceorrhizus]